MAGTIYDNGHVQVSLEYNFSLDKLERWLSKDALAAAMIECKKYLLEEVKSRFMLQRGPGRSKWKALSKLTVKFKGGNKRKLWKSGALAKSIEGIAYADQVVLYTNTPYAKMMQEGATYKTTMKQSVWLWYNIFDKQGHPFTSKNITIPPRPFFGFDDGNIRHIQSIIYRQIKKGENIGI